MGDAFIIAIDFGTAYSGYAFLISGKEPIVPQWGLEHGVSTPKTPTCILFDEEEQFLKFGYDAKKEYTGKGNESAKKRLLFENFKMELYGKVSVLYAIDLYDITIKKVKVKKRLNKDDLNSICLNILSYIW